MKLKATKYDLKQNLNGDMELTLHIADESLWAVRQIPKQEDLNGELAVEIKKFINHRTINQNELLWAIETKLADFYNKNVNEIHKANLIAYGVPLGPAIMRYENAEEFCKENYAKIEKEKTEKGKRIALFTIYKGSSQLNTKEFSHLIEAILEEAKGNNIDIADDKADFESLQKQWEKKSEKETNKSN